MKPLHLAVLLLAAATAPAQSSDKPVNLLAKAHAGAQPIPEGLADGNPATVATAKGGPLEAVFAFTDIVTPEKVQVKLPRGAAAAARLEVFASTVSEDGGYVFVRGDTLRTGLAEHEFQLPQTAAKWVLLRFTGGDEVAVSDVALLGREGPPQSRYEFGESPAKAIELVAGLKGLSELKFDVTPDETSLFEDAKDGKFDTWTFAEAAILSCGVTERERRAEYLRRIDTLFEEAKTATGKAATPTEKGEALLKWMHAGVMKKGYVSEQTDVTAVLDTGTYNCVSSATLYNILGRRLGLDLRGIEVPDHAFAIWYDGTTHADVETTTPMGFNPSRDPKTIAAFQKETGFTYLPDKHRNLRRELGETGMVALTYYNHGVMHARKKQHLESLLFSLRAVSLDPEFGSAVKNALSSLATWSADLAKAGKHEAAVAVVEAGVAIAPKDPTLLHNRTVCWREFAEARMRAGREAEAIEILKQAAARSPGNADIWVSLQAGLFIRRGEELIKAGDWEKALQIGASAPLDEKPRAELDRWRSGARTRRAIALVKEKKFGEALDVLAGGTRDARTAQNIAWTVQEWAKLLPEDEGLELLKVQARRFPDVPAVKSVALAQVERAIGAHGKAGKDEEGVALAERSAEFVKELGGDPARVLLVAYDGWGQKLMKAKEWAKAVDVYARARKALPSEKVPAANLSFCLQEGARDLFTKEGEAAAREFLKPFAKDHPEIAKNYVLWIVSTLCKAGEFESAAGAAGRHKDFLEKPVEAARSAYDQWARSYSQKKEWKEAAEVYTKALAEYPGDAHLENNAAATWDNWARTHYPAKNWAEAIRIYEEGLKVLPKSQVLKKNLEYCRAQAGG
jgi:tetratricopeptide (TPR) repeat protein